VIKEILREIELGIILLILILALVGFDQAERPWMPEHGSIVSVETEYWLDK